MFDSDDEKDSGFAEAATQQPVRISILRDDLPAHIGGRRGLFANTDIAAGSLVVLEWPTLTWDKSLLSLDDGIWTIIKQIIQHPQSHQLTRQLHPRNVTDVPTEEFQRVEEKFREIAPSMMNNVAVGVDREEILRLYLVLQHNGFQSGLYLHLCMLNHSCLPNCIKFEPRTGSRGASEVWTTTNISAGEELLISYVSPLETSYPIAQEFLQSHHGFQCQCRRCIEASVYYRDENDAEETVQVDVENVDNESTDIPERKHQETLPKKIDNIEANFEGIEQMLQVATQTYRRPPDIEVIEESLETLDLIWEQFNSFNSANGNNSSIIQISEHELLRLRIRTQSIQCSLLSGAIELFDGQKDHIVMAREYSQKLVSTSVKLYQKQLSFLGKDHPNLATTLTDLSNGLEFLCRVLSPTAAAENDQYFDDTESQLSSFCWIFSLNEKQQQEVIRRAGTDKRKQFLFKLKLEIDRLKDLFMLAKNVPAAVKVLKGPGVVFWGMSSY